eukprot:TRINITY_DN5240_c2_g1_i1.p1 TRINITY_DN5240_c2_g1~~TRINITY_DN5240_c2_g1_i1.p1  ORF type:complete len:115 (+),score=4.39 TRINITY_DN5240_c2_g1_i1:233-577(+)
MKHFLLQWATQERETMMKSFAFQKLIYLIRSLFFYKKTYEYFCPKDEIIDFSKKNDNYLNNFKLRIRILCLIFELKKLGFCKRKVTLNQTEESMSFCNQIFQIKNIHFRRIAKE